jgi:hypothetical protein
LHGCTSEKNQRVCLLSDDASAEDVQAHEVGALRASVIAAISAMLEDLELTRQRQAPPPDIEEFIATTAAVLARLREAAPPEDPRA